MRQHLGRMRRILLSGTLLSTSEFSGSWPLRGLTACFLRKSMIRCEKDFSEMEKLLLREADISSRGESSRHYEDLNPPQASRAINRGYPCRRGILLAGGGCRWVPSPSGWPGVRIYGGLASERCDQPTTSRSRAWYFPGSLCFRPSGCRWVWACVSLEYRGRSVPAAAQVS